MKKSKVALLAALFIAPVLILSGCEEPKYFTISATVSNNNYGSISGGNDTYIEGGDVKLIATAYNDSQNPFLCWIKDYNEIYSRENPLVIKSSEETKGNYTAVFAENSISSMSYAVATDVSYTSSDYTNIEYSITCAPIDNLQEAQNLAQGVISVNEDENRLDSAVLNLFQKGSQPFTYQFTINLKVTTRDETINNLVYQDISISNSNFDRKTGSLVITQDYFSIKFEKLNKAMFEEN